jgi:hypothetical protein
LYEARAVVMAKVRSERELVDNGPSKSDEGSEPLRYSPRECVWTRYIKRPVSIIPASRFIHPREFYSASQII